MTDPNVRFEKDGIYPSAVEGISYVVRSIHHIQDSVVMVVYRLTASAWLGAGLNTYLAVVDEKDCGRVTVMLDKGFTTMYAEGDKRI